MAGSDYRILRRGPDPCGLKRENERLKQLVAELSLEVLVLKKTAIPEFE